MMLQDRSSSFHKVWFINQVALQLTFLLVLGVEGAGAFVAGIDGKTFTKSISEHSFRCPERTVIDCKMYNFSVIPVPLSLASLCISFLDLTYTTWRLGREYLAMSIGVFLTASSSHSFQTASTAEKSP